MFNIVSLPQTPQVPLKPYELTDGIKGGHCSAGKLPSAEPYLRVIGCYYYAHSIRASTGSTAPRNHGSVSSIHYGGPVLSRASGSLIGGRRTH